jgi:DNA-directed RNA polymerase specialized sigma24 family protein
VSDVDDFAEFAAASEQRFYRHAYLLCHDREQARDLVQATLLKLYRVWRRIRRNEHLHAYAHRTLVRAYLDGQRRFVVSVISSRCRSRRSPSTARTSG